MKNTLLNVLAHDLEANGCATRFKNPRTLEVYGINLAEHYLFSLKKSSEAAVEILFVPQAPEYSGVKPSI